MVAAWSTGRWWRPVVHAPACVIGAALIAGSAGWWTNRWGAVVAVAVWALSSTVMLPRRGERFLMSLFRWSSIDLTETFSEPVASTLERLVGDLGIYDFYEAPAESPNALAVGGHTVGVTSMLIRLYRQGAIDDQHVVAVLLHEIGHHRGQSLRYTAVVTYLVQPWHWARRILGAVGLGFREMARATVIGSMLVAVIAVAALGGTAVALSVHPVASSATIAVLLVLFVVMPWLEGILSRAEELSADRYALDLGYGRTLAEFLRWIDENTNQPPRGRFATATSLHPSHRERVVLLEA